MGPLERRDGSYVIVGFHVNLAEIQKGLDKVWISLRGLAKLGDGHVKATLLMRLNARLHVLSPFGRDTLQGQREE